MSIPQKMAVHRRGNRSYDALGLGHGNSALHWSFSYSECDETSVINRNCISRIDNMGWILIACKYPKNVFYEATFWTFATY